jgi:hypothetical protein
MTRNPDTRPMKHGCGTMVPDYAASVFCKACNLVHLSRVRVAMWSSGEAIESEQLRGLLEVS